MAAPAILAAPPTAGVYAGRPKKLGFETYEIKLRVSAAKKSGVTDLTGFAAYFLLGEEDGDLELLPDLEPGQVLGDGEDARLRRPGAVPAWDIRLADDDQRRHQRQDGRPLPACADATDTATLTLQS